MPKPRQRNKNSTKQNKAKQNKTKQNKTKQSKAKQSKAKQSKAMQSKAKQSKAKQSKAKQSKAKQSKAKPAKQSKAKNDIYFYDETHKVRILIIVIYYNGISIQRISSKDKRQNIINTKYVTANSFYLLFTLRKLEIFLKFRRQSLLRMA